MPSPTGAKGSARSALPSRIGLLTLDPVVVSNVALRHTAIGARP
jgi:hypothetical protein